MHTKFIQALMWNTSAAFLYKIMLLGHQILLYSVISKNMYGLQSYLFSTIYFTIAITNFGFDETLLPFFSTYSSTKSNFISLLSKLFTHIIIITFTTFIMYLYFTHGSGEFLHNLQFYCNKKIIFVITAIFFVESLKKSI